MIIVCWPDDLPGYNCHVVDIIVAFNVGVHDGFDVFSVSLGGSSPLFRFFSALVSPFCGTTKEMMSRGPC